MLQSMGSQRVGHDLVTGQQGGCTSLCSHWQCIKVIVDFGFSFVSLICVWWYIIVVFNFEET